MSAVQQVPGTAHLHEVSIPRVGRGSRYFQGTSILLLVIVLTGFSRTFFLRAFFQVPPLAPHIYVHAVVMTAWFTLLAVQTSLVAAHRTDLHRRLGILGGVLAVAVAGLSLVTALGLPAHFKADPVPNGTPMTPDGMIQIAWANFGDLTLFCIFVAAAIGMRRRPEAHKRLLLLASIAFMGPAIGRYIADLDIWGASSSVPSVVQMLRVLAGALAVALPLTLVVHDLRTRRRLHPATAWGVLGIFLVQILAHAPFGVSATAAGRALIIGLQ